MLAFPPGPSQLAALRGMYGGSDLSNLSRFLTRLAEKYGAVSSWRVGRRRFYFTPEPALVEEVLVTRSRDYIKGIGTQRLKPLLGEGLLTSEDPFHLRQRRMMQPAFHRERIAHYGETMVSATQAHASAWENGTELAIDAEMMRLTLGIAAATLFSANVSSQANTISDALSGVMHAFPATLSPLHSIREKLPFYVEPRRFAESRARLDAVIFQMIAERRRDGSAGEVNDLLGMLLAARDEDGTPMSDEQIRDEALTIFLAGHETTANALAWTWYLLAEHPAVEARLHEEIDRVLGDRTATAEDVPRLTYTHDVVAETMRLYPPAWGLGRKAIRETKLGPWTIPEGALVLVTPLVTQRHAQWWPQPHTFRPERWAEDAKGRPKFAYFPFGGGGRLCIGEPFAWMEAVLIVATIAQRWRFIRTETGPIEMQPLVTLRPKTAVKVRAERRVRVPQAV
jgi:cytochrome P450